MFPVNSRILIVDDIESLRELLTAYLHRMGFEHVEEAEDGRQALQKLRYAKAAGKPFRLVISDWNMPIMTGLELLKEVRETPDWKDLPFLFLTTESEKHRVLLALESGVSNYIVKPIDEPQLREKLQKMWDRMQKKK